MDSRGSGTAEVEVVAFAGWQHNLRLFNDEVELLVTLDVGPRVLRYGPRDGVNLLKLNEAELGRSGEPGWVMRGGHRLWSAPEDPGHTYAPDNGPVRHRVEGKRVFLGAPPAAGLQRGMMLELADRGSRLRIVHTLENVGGKPVDVAVWAITVLPPGGEAVIPLPPARPHPGGPDGASAADFAPQLTLALWPYFRFGDPRFRFGERFIRIRHDVDMPPAKIGLSLSEGWAGYAREGWLFVKSVPEKKGASYVDGGCNFESFTDPNILELETLSPLGKLAPGARLEHEELWALVRLDGDLPDSEALLVDTIAPRARAALK